MGWLHLPVPAALKQVGYWTQQQQNRKQTPTGNPGCHMDVEFQLKNCSEQENILSWLPDDILKKNI